MFFLKFFLRLLKQPRKIVKSSALLFKKAIWMKFQTLSFDVLNSFSQKQILTINP